MSSYLEQFKAGKHCKIGFDSDRNSNVSFKIIKKKNDGDPINEKTTPI